MKNCNLCNNLCAVIFIILFAAGFYNALEWLKNLSIYSVCYEAKSKNFELESCKHFGKE